MMEIIFLNDGDYFLSTSDLAVYATNIGRLIWVLPTQLRSSYEISQLARRRTCARASDYNRLRTLILSIRLNPQRMTISRLSDQLGIKVIAVVDAGGSEKVKAPLKPRDQQCIMVLLAEAVPPGAASTAVVVYFASNGISRICHSSFDMEAVAGVSALDVSLNIRRGVGEFLFGVCPSFRAALLLRRVPSGILPSACRFCEMLRGSSCIRRLSLRSRDISERP